MADKIYNMFYGAPPVIHKLAKELRGKETKAEKFLWNCLSNHQLKVKFRRQHPIRYFIVDFYCHKLKLVIEADGEIHNRKEQREYDKMPDEHLKALGLQVIRFSNEEILKKTEQVIGRIEKTIENLK